MLWIILKKLDRIEGKFGTMHQKDDGMNERIHNIGKKIFRIEYKGKMEVTSENVENLEQEIKRVKNRTEVNNGKQIALANEVSLIKQKGDDLQR